MRCCTVVTENRIGIGSGAMMRGLGGTEFFIAWTQLEVPKENNVPVSSV
jgi:hypothetical protein